MTINTNNAKRGSIPADKQYFAPEALEKLRKASRHVCYLVNEGYDLKMAYTFVGNHFLCLNVRDLPSPAALRQQSN